MNKLTQKQLQIALDRTKAVSDHATKAICQSIETRTGLADLDRLFDQSKRANALFWRIYGRLQALRAE